MAEGNRVAPVRVEVLLRGTSVSGLAPMVEARRRLVDLLNGPDESLELQAVCLTLPGGEQRFLPGLAVQKRAIIVAVPHETAEHIRLRAVMSAGISRARRLPLPVSVLAPPLYLEGMAYLPETTLPRDPVLADLTRFFPLTGTRILLEDGSWLEAEVAVVNRDFVASIARLAG